MRSPSCVMKGLVEVRHGHGTFVVEPPGRVKLLPGDTATSTAAITVTHADGEIEIYPAGTTLAVGD